MHIKPAYEVMYTDYFSKKILIGSNRKQNQNTEQAKLIESNPKGTFSFSWSFTFDWKISLFLSLVKLLSAENLDSTKQQCIDLIHFLSYTDNNLNFLQNYSTLLPARTYIKQRNNKPNKKAFSAYFFLLLFLHYTANHVCKSSEIEA